MWISCSGVATSGQSSNRGRWLGVHGFWEKASYHPPGAVERALRAISCKPSAMPLALRTPCPHCGRILYRKRAGRCPACGGAVSEHVTAVRKREERIEKVVAIIGTILVLAVFLLTSGLGLVEGVVMYAAAGAAVFYLAKRTFKPNRQPEE